VYASTRTRTTQLGGQGPRAGGPSVPFLLVSRLLFRAEETNTQHTKLTVAADTPLIETCPRIIGIARRVASEAHPSPRRSSTLAPSNGWHTSHLCWMRRTTALLRKHRHSRWHRTSHVSLLKRIHRHGSSALAPSNGKPVLRRTASEASIATAAGATHVVAAPVVLSMLQRRHQRSAASEASPQPLASHVSLPKRIHRRGSARWRLRWHTCVVAHCFGSIATAADATSWRHR
jgi:hypothetical protein